MSRDLPGREAQRLGINRWLVKFGGRRHSEAAMEVTTMSDAKRRQIFRALRTAGCIEYQVGDTKNPAGWYAVKDSTKSEEV